MRFKFLNLLLLLNVFLVPLVPSFFGFGYELIKVLVFLSLAIISGLIFVFLLYVKRVKTRWTKIKIASLLFLIILSLTSIFGIHAFESLTGKYPYYQGLILYWFLFLFSLMASEIKFGKKRLISAIVFSAVIVSVVSIVQFIILNLLNIQIPNYAGRVVSTFGQPNLYSGFLLLSLPFAFPAKRKKLIPVLIISAGIIISGSKAAIILLFVLGLFMLIKKTAHKSLVVFLMLVILLNAFTYSLQYSTGLVWDEVIRPFTKRGTEGYLIEKRAYITPVILDIFFKNPLSGFGLDSISTLYKDEFADFRPELKNYPPLYFNLKNLVIDRSHNYFLDLLIFSGVIGLTAYLYLVYLLFKTKKPGFLKIFLILYLVWIQFQVQSIVHLMLFWLIVGVVDTKEKLKDDKL